MTLHSEGRSPPPSRFVSEPGTPASGTGVVQRLPRVSAGYWGASGRVEGSLKGAMLTGHTESCEHSRWGGCLLPRDVGLPFLSAGSSKADTAPQTPQRSGQARQRPGSQGQAVPTPYLVQDPHFFADQAVNVNGATERPSLLLDSMSRAR